MFAGEVNESPRNLYAVSLRPRARNDVDTPSRCVLILSLFLMTILRVISGEVTVPVHEMGYLQERRHVIAIH